MKKSRKNYLIFLFLLVIFTMSLVNKTMQNDTFFYIPIGERIAKTHIIDGLDHWSYHENLRFTYPGWICNLIMYFLYNKFGFTGIYILVLIMSGLITLVLFKNLVKEKNNLILSFVIVILAVYFSKIVFAARNQIFSFLIFELEISCLIELVENGKKKYFWALIILAFLLVLFHDTLYVLFWVIMLPYIADIILSNIFKIENSYKFKNSELKNAKYLILLFIVTIPIGFCTPIFATTYTNLINCMNGVSTEFIEELQTVELIEDVSLATITFLAIGVFGFTKTKFKLKDVLFVFGFIIFAMMARRNMFFLYLIGIIYLTNMITDCMNTYIGEEEKNNFFGKLENSKYLITVIFCFISILSINNFSYQLTREYVSDIIFPKEATEWILENVDYNNMRIWNSFNWGSYLELNGIKVFVDSRSGMYTEQENEGCTVLKDWYAIYQGKGDYQEKFDKYNITHILVNSSENLNKDLEKDNNYKMIYQDDLFVLYERK